jgi:hypothetical protein
MLRLVPDAEALARITGNIGFELLMKIGNSTWIIRVEFAILRFRKQ